MTEKPTDRSCMEKLLSLYEQQVTSAEKEKVIVAIRILEKEKHISLDKYFFRRWK